MGGHDYPENPTPCKCPVCGGFLKWELSNPICNKCKTELMIFPEIDEETGEELEYGKICPISSRDTHEKRSQE